MSKTSTDLEKGLLARYTKAERTFLVTLRGRPDNRGIALMPN